MKMIILSLTVLAVLEGAVLLVRLREQLDFLSDCIKKELEGIKRQTKQLMERRRCRAGRKKSGTGRRKSRNIRNVIIKGGMKRT